MSSTCAFSSAICSWLTASPISRSASASATHNRRHSPNLRCSPNSAAISCDAYRLISGLSYRSCDTRLRPRVDGVLLRFCLPPYSILLGYFLATGRPMRSIITLTTDFGVSSPYVAQMKGVILSICRDVDLIDISHAIGPQNIREAAVVLADNTPRFPSGTIHVAVVDPGVGTARRIVYAEIGEQRYIAPDNGLLSRLAAANQPDLIVALENKNHWLPERSHTFHGRDIMAPVAAHLAASLDPRQLGPARSGIVKLDWPAPQRSMSGVAGQVLMIDSFGNVISNISDEDLDVIGSPASLEVECGGRKIRGIVPTYGAAMHGEIVALIDSQGRLEIAKVGGNVASELQIQVGEAVEVTQP